jgi:transcriptional regulator with XRE-family HTH domain
MKERLTTLMELEKLTPSRFADLIGVQRSSVSHILAERNKPSFDFIEKTLKAFPGLRAEWLILGTGEMFGSGVRVHDLFGDEDLSGDASETAQSGESERRSDTGTNKIERGKDESDKEHSVLRMNESSLATRRVIQVVVMYEDHTFETYRPSE